MDVYGFWRSQATFRLRVALNIKGIAYREIPIDLDGGEQNAEKYRAINPMGGVPALMVEGTPVTQSLAILEYIEESYPDPPLLPKDPMGRARVRSLAAIAVSDTHPLIVPRVRRFLAKVGDLDLQAWKAWQTHWFSAGLRGYETRLARDADTGSCCHGDIPTFADICLAGLMAGAETFDIAVDDIPTVDRIVACCMAQPAFEAARAIHQSDFPPERR